MRPRWAHRAGAPCIRKRMPVTRLCWPTPFLFRNGRIYFIFSVLLTRLTPRRKNPKGSLSWGSHFLYAYGFRICFTPLPGFFSPFPHGTGSLSVDYEYLALEDGPPIFRQDFTCPALLLATLVPPPRFRLRGYHPLWPAFPDRSANAMAKDCRLIRFRSPLLSESRLISVPCPTEMFQFRQFAPLSL